jgi:hypothetical protein
MTMKLDVRLPIGAMFTLDGVVLAGYGLMGGRADAVAKAGFNITSLWGVVLALFGATMLGLALRARR